MPEGPPCSKYHPSTRAWSGGGGPCTCGTAHLSVVSASGFTAPLQAGLQGQLPPIHYFQPRSGSGWTGQPLTLSFPPQAPPPPNAPEAPGRAGLYTHCPPSHPLFQSAISEATCSLRLLGSPTSFRFPAPRWNQVLSDLDRPLAELLRAHGDRPALYHVTPGRATVRMCDTSLRKKSRRVKGRKPEGASSSVAGPPTLGWRGSSGIGPGWGQWRLALARTGCPRLWGRGGAVRACCQGLLSGRRVWAVMGPEPVPGGSEQREMSLRSQQLCVPPHPPLGQRNSSCPQIRPEF